MKLLPDFILIVALCLISGCTSYRVVEHLEHLSFDSHESHEDPDSFASKFCLDTHDGHDHEDYYAEVARAEAKLYACAGEMIDIDAQKDEFFENLLFGNSPDSIREYFTRKCPQIYHALQCFDEFYEIGIKCLHHDIEMQNIFNTSIRVYKRFADFICNSNGKPVIEFLQNEGLECVLPNYKLFESCFMKHGNIFNHGVLNQCKDINAVSNCVVEIIQTTCKNPTIAELIENVLDIFKLEYNCGLHPTTTYRPEVNASTPAHWKHPVKSFTDEFCTHSHLGHIYYEQVSAAEREMFECMGNLPDINTIRESIIKNLLSGNTPEEIHDYFGHHCPNIYHALDCFDRFYEIASICLQDHSNVEREMNRSISIYKNLIDYICNGNGYHIAFFIENAGLECVTKTHHSLGLCFGFDLNYPFGTEQNYIGHIDHFDQISGDSHERRECNHLDSVRSCVESTIRNSCDNDWAAYTFYDIFEIIKNNIDCYSYNYHESKKQVLNGVLHFQLVLEKEQEYYPV